MRITIFGLHYGDLSEQGMIKKNTLRDNVPHAMACWNGVAMQNGIYACARAAAATKYSGPTYN
tara:strand:- start:1792 stop:1980 length:189 start_codon:yes stop_codon:yes gene_type:complete